MFSLFTSFSLVKELKNLVDRCGVFLIETLLHTIFADVTTDETRVTVFEAILLYFRKSLTHFKIDQRLKKLPHRTACGMHVMWPLLIRFYKKMSPQRMRNVECFNVKLQLTLRYRLHNKRFGDVVWYPLPKLRWLQIWSFNIRQPVLFYCLVPLVISEFYVYNYNLFTFLVSSHCF